MSGTVYLVDRNEVETVWAWEGDLPPRSIERLRPGSQLMDANTDGLPVGAVKLARVTFNLVASSGKSHTDEWTAIYSEAVP